MTVDDTEWVERRVNEAVQTTGAVTTSASAELQRMLQGDLSARQLRVSELSAVARNLLSLMSDPGAGDEN